MSADNAATMLHTMRNAPEMERDVSPSLSLFWFSLFSCLACACCDFDEVWGWSMFALTASRIALVLG